jgi:hypothetical protein
MRANDMPRIPSNLPLDAFVIIVEHSLRECAKSHMEPVVRHKCRERTTLVEFVLFGKIHGQSEPA